MERFRTIQENPENSAKGSGKGAGTQKSEKTGKIEGVNPDLNLEQSVLDDRERLGKGLSKAWELSKWRKGVKYVAESVEESFNRAFTIHLNLSANLYPSNPDDFIPPGNLYRSLYGNL